MKTFMLTYPSSEGNQVLFESASDEKQAVIKFRTQLGRKLLPWKSEVIALKIEGSDIKKLEPKPKKGRGKYFRWAETDIVELLEKYSIMSIGNANTEYVERFVREYKNDLINR